MSDSDDQHDADDFDAPDRGSAEELLDAGAHERPRRDAPLDRARHGRGGAWSCSPSAKLGIGPAIEDGFYYDFDLPRAADARRPRGDRGADARRSVAADLPFERSELDRGRGDAPSSTSAGQPYKVEIIGDLRRAPRRPESRSASTSSTARSTTCAAGPHLEPTGKIGPFKLLSSAGAYWRGDEKRPMLQRIYGTVWETQEELDQYLWRRRGGEEARPPQARARARPVQLPSRVAGRPVLASARAWPCGAPSRTGRARSAARAASTRCGRPAVVRKELWETSGHWALYQDNMFVLEDGDHVSGPEADELPGVDAHLQDRAALVPRPADAPGRLLAGSSATSGPARWPACSGCAS